MTIREFDEYCKNVRSHVTLFVYESHPELESYNLEINLVCDSLIVNCADRYICIGTDKMPGMLRVNSISSITIEEDHEDRSAKILCDNGNIYEIILV